jgi:uncharacterized membrane protein YhaH (DUF805 family)
MKMAPHGPGVVIFMIAVCMLIYLGFAVTVRRCHDLGRSGWLTLLGFVPLVNLAFGLYLLFAKGQSGSNAYGPALDTAST